MVAGNIAATMGFFALNLLICLSNVLYAPVLSILRSIYGYQSFDEGAAAFDAGSGELRDWPSGDDGYGYGGQGKQGYGALEGENYALAAGERKLYKNCIFSKVNKKKLPDRRKFLRWLKINLKKCNDSQKLLANNRSNDQKW